jgi:hypothetical protein
MNAPLPDDVARLAAELAAVNEAVRRAHEAITDLRRERQTLTVLAAEIKAITSKKAEQLIDSEIRRQISVMGPAIRASLGGKFEEVIGQEMTLRAEAIVDGIIRTAVQNLAKSGTFSRFPR